MRNTLISRNTHLKIHFPGGPGTTVSKVTRSRSWGAKPAGVVVYNRHGEPAGLEPAAGYSSPAPASTVGLGYRPNTAMSAKSGRSNTGGQGQLSLAGNLYFPVFQARP